MRKGLNKCGDPMILNGGGAGGDPMILNGGLNKFGDTLSLNGGGASAIYHDKATWTGSIAGHTQFWLTWLAVVHFLSPYLPARSWIYPIFT